MVLDRFFLWTFTAACLLGTAGIILRAPSLYDPRKPIDEELSHIEEVFLRVKFTNLFINPKFSYCVSNNLIQFVLILIHLK